MNRFSGADNFYDNDNFTVIIFNDNESPKVSMDLAIYRIVDYIWLFPLPTAKEQVEIVHW